jgi:cysteine synthase
MSKIIRSGDRIFTKLEMNNPGGSHKYRAASSIIEAGLRRGEITPGLVLVESYPRPSAVFAEAAL